MSGYRSPRHELFTKVHNRHRKRYWKDRDPRDHECEGCGRGYNVVGNRWEVHHCDGDWLNGHPLNLVGICQRCHSRIHRVEGMMARIAEWKANAPVNEEVTP